MGIWGISPTIVILRSLSGAKPSFLLYYYGNHSLSTYLPRARSLAGSLIVILLSILHHNEASSCPYLESEVERVK